MADEKSQILTGDGDNDNSKAELKNEEMDESKDTSVEKEEIGDDASESPKKETKKEKDTGSPKKEAKKNSESPQKEAKKGKDGDNSDDNDDEEDEVEDDSEEEELPPGLLEQPLEVTGKREKKKVERLSATMVPATSAQKKKVEIEEGCGQKLGDIPYVEHQLNITKAVDLKPLHRVLFARQSTNIECKRNIRQFCGFTHDKDSKEIEKRMATLNKFFVNDLKSICLTLGLDRSGSKKEIAERIIDFLMNPQDTGAKVKAKRRSKSAGGAKKGKKRKRAPKGTKTPKKTSSKKKKSKEDVSEDEEEDDDEEEENGKDEEEEEEEEDHEDEEEEDDIDEDEDEESEDEQPKKKKLKVEPKKKAEPKKKTPPKKVAKQNGKKEKAPKKEKKEVKKSTPKKKPAPISSDDDNLSDDSDDEPIAKMKKSAPSNDEIKDLVKKILDGADLETVTMKTVVKQVYAKYPSFDLSDRKDFIKDTVREVIS